MECRLGYVGRRRVAAQEDAARAGSSDEDLYRALFGDADALYSIGDGPPLPAFISWRIASRPSSRLGAPGGANGSSCTPPC